jgi:hypothetical protein
MGYRNQGEMFRAIRENRPFVSEISGKPLITNVNDFHYHWQFAHVLSKGAYPRFKLFSDNIMLMTWQEHEEQTNGRFRDAWTKEQIAVFEEKRDFLKQKYYE